MQHNTTKRFGFGFTRTGDQVGQQQLPRVGFGVRGSGFGTNRNAWGNSMPQAPPLVWRTRNKKILESVTGVKKDGAGINQPHLPMRIQIGDVRLSHPHPVFHYGNSRHPWNIRHGIRNHIPHNARPDGILVQSLRHIQGLVATMRYQI